MSTIYDTKKIKAFLPKSNPQLNGYRNQLIGVLHAANIQVLQDPRLLPFANCSIHVLGNQYNSATNNQDISDDELFFNQALDLNKKSSSFRIFIWQPPALNNEQVSPKQAHFINNIHNNMFQNMTLSKHPSPVMFVEDIRSILYTEQKEVFDIRPADVFFIYNEIDEDKGNSIVELLNDVLKVEKLNISLKTPTDYSELIAQQIQKSQLTTIYFNRTSNWAIPFAKQVWKKIGGASANKQILMISDSDYDQNKDIIFNAPNVSNLNTGSELIPLETKVFYDKMQLTN
jgi:hypothetical protein